MAKESINPNALIGLATVGLVFFAGKKLLGIFNFGGDSEKDKKNEAAVTAMISSNAFSPNYYKGKSGVPLVTMATGLKLAEIIYDAKGYFNDDEAAVYGALQQLNYKTQLSFLSEIFFNKYKTGLLGYIQSMFNAEEMANVATIVNKMKP